MTTIKPFKSQWHPHFDEIYALVSGYKEEAPIVFKILHLLDGLSYRKAAETLSLVEDLLKRCTHFNSEDSGLQHIRHEVLKCLENKNQSPQQQDE